MPRVTVTRAEPGDLAEVRRMLDEYQAWVGVDLCFQDFTNEVRDLPGDYAPPGGDLFIARLGDDTVGMIAFRRRPDGRAEMKRLFVRPSARGAGTGRALVERVIDAARRAGYTQLVLDTLPVMAGAQKLYEQFGFHDIAPYYESPIGGTRYMALDLTAHRE
jgi:ribosomal protein S18 acetylase RimI-like enzyme